MGFNIGVLPKTWNDKWEDVHECDQFLERTFYNFVASGEVYGDESILIQSGKYYELDLSLFLKVVYTWDGISEEDIDANTQQLDSLLSIVENFRKGIAIDASVCDKINYRWYESVIDVPEAGIQNLIEELGEEMATPFLAQIEEQKRRAIEEPNPWKFYFETGQILDDLDALIKNLQCFKLKGISEVFLTAG